MNTVNKYRPTTVAWETLIHTQHRLCSNTTDGAVVYRGRAPWLHTTRRNARDRTEQVQLECGPMPNVMVALTNIGGALCSMPQSLADAHYYMPCSNAAKTRRPLKFEGCPKLVNRSQPLVGRSSPYCGGHLEKILLLNKFFSDCRYVP